MRIPLFDSVVYALSIVLINWLIPNPHEMFEHAAWHHLWKNIKLKDFHPALGYWLIINIFQSQLFLVYFQLLDTKSQSKLRRSAVNTIFFLVQQLEKSSDIICHQLVTRVANYTHRSRLQSTYLAFCNMVSDKHLNLSVHHPDFAMTQHVQESSQGSWSLVRRWLEFQFHTALASRKKQPR